MLTSDEKKSPPATDGRVRRSERSRAAIVQALFELIGEGVAAPTADEVAERASIGIRTVFRQFKDMDTLYGALDVLLYERYEPFFLAPVPEGPIDERIEEFVARRTKGYEGIAPYKRAANIKRARSEFLQERHEALVRRIAQRPSSLVSRAEEHGRAHGPCARARHVVRGLGSTPHRSTPRQAAGSRCHETGDVRGSDCAGMTAPQR